MKKIWQKIAAWYAVEPPPPVEIPHKSTCIIEPAFTEWVARTAAKEPNA